MLRREECVICGWCWFCRLRTAGKLLVSLIARALNMDEDFFEKIGAFNPPMPFLRLRLLHYPGLVTTHDDCICLCPFSVHYS